MNGMFSIDSLVATRRGSFILTFRGQTSTAKFMRPLRGQEADIEADDDDAAIADLEAELKMKRDVRDDKYVALNEKRSKVGLGVAGSADYGNDSPLYGAMGFVRKSERASGLTRKTKPTGSNG
jgi:hypothetical protein